MKATSAAAVTHALRRSDLGRFVGKGMAIRVLGTSDGEIRVWTDSPTLVKDVLEAAGFVVEWALGSVRVVGRR